jgi:transposase
MENSEKNGGNLGKNIGFEPEKALFLAKTESIESAVSYFQDIVKIKEFTIAQTQATITQKELTIAQKEQEIAELTAQVEKFQRMIFGQTRERFIQQPATQISLEFGEITPDEIAGIQTIINEKKESIRKKENAEPKQPTKRIPLPKHLQVVETVIQPEGDLTDMVLVKNEVSDYLEYQPSKHFIRRIVRPIYAPKAKEGSFKVACVPDNVFEKSKVGVGLVSHLLYSKFVLHLPIDRLLKELLREQIPTNSSTIYNWVKLGINRLEILYEYKFNQQIAKNYLQLDETTLKVLESDRKGATHLGYFWVYNDPLSGACVFKYEKGRSAIFPEEVLKNYRGYLQTDGYSGYNGLAKSDRITQLCCWAHARRKFEEALKNDKARAEVAMALVGELYDIERTAREENLNNEQRKTLRLEKSLPVYNLLGKWIAANMPKTLPKSTIHAAMRYSFERWEELGNYMYDGRLEIDNNLVENAIRPVAIGRKNWLFAGTHESAQRLAIMYTFMSDCKKHNVNPEHWLNNVIEKIPSANIQELHLLLPENFGKTDGLV